MSIQSEINRISGAKSDIANAIQDKGVTVPSGTKLDGMANLIGQISGGSGKLNSTQAADAYDPTATYAVGDKVSYAGNVYSCISAISTPEAWDSTHWDQVDPIQDQVDDVRNTLNSEIATRQTYVRPNLLDNWYFGNPVNQRGQNSYVGNTYGIDRWYVGDGGGTVAIQSGSIKITPPSGGYTIFCQKIETKIRDYLVGKKITASVLLKNGHLASGTITCPAADSTDWTTICYAELFTVQIVPAGSRFHLYISNENGGEVQAIKLELGSTQTLAHNEGTEANPVWVLNEIPDYDEQLYRCCSSTADSNDTYAKKPYSNLSKRIRHNVTYSGNFNNAHIIAETSGYFVFLAGFFSNTTTTQGVVATVNGANLLPEIAQLSVPCQCDDGSVPYVRFDNDNNGNVVISTQMNLTANKVVRFNATFPTKM